MCICVNSYCSITSWRLWFHRRLFVQQFSKIRCRHRNYVTLERAVGHFYHQGLKEIPFLWPQIHLTSDASCLQLSECRQAAVAEPIWEPIGYQSDNDLASLGNGQYLRESTEASGYLNHRYPCSLFTVWLATWDTIHRVLVLYKHICAYWKAKKSSDDSRWFLRLHLNQCVPRLSLSTRTFNLHATEACSNMTGQCYLDYKQKGKYADICLLQMLSNHQDHS